MRTRRTLLAGLAGVLAGSVDTALPQGPSDGSPTGSQPTDHPSTASPTVNLREATVTEVLWDGTPSGEATLSVTLYHDDASENGFANWWQVETLAGDRLGRRELFHAHGTREFTRAGSYAIPEDIVCAVVRDRKETHDYGGQATLINLTDE